MATRKPAVMIAGQLQDLPAADSLAGGSSVAGTAIVDFGAGGATDTSIAVTGQSAIVAGSKVFASVLAMASADHTADEHWAEELFVIAGSVIAGTGFTIYARGERWPCFGKFNVAWNWA